MAYHPFVLRAPTTDTEWPAAGSPVFALKIDDERLEYWDPNSQRDNVLRTLLVKAFMAQGVPVEQAKANASNLITEAIEEVSITAWRAKIMGPFDSDASFQNRQLNRFVKTVSTDAQRYDFLANYDFVFLGVAGRNMVHHRLKDTYSHARILQAPCMVDGVTIVTFPRHLWPVYEQKSPDGYMYAAGTTLWWDAYDGVPVVEPTRDNLPGANVFQLGRIVQVGFDNVAVALKTPTSSTAPLRI